MKLLLIITLLGSVYCSENEGIKNEERRIAGGGNYGGFIGLTTYGGGPFLVKGKFETEVRPNPEYNDGGKQGDSSNKDDIDKKGNDKKDGDFEVKTIGNVDYETIQKDQYSYDNGVNRKNNDLEDLGYKGEGCVGQFENFDNYGNRNKYGRQRGRGSNRTNQGSGNYSTYYDEETRDRCDYVYGYTGPTANDEPENLMRPCALDDWQCIRKFFAANSKCKPAYGPIPDPLYIDINTVFHPIVNLTIALPNLRVRGLSSARVKDFYVNKESGNLVFVIEVSNFNESIPRAYFRYRRTAKESIVLADYATIEYSAITFTAVIPKVPNLRLDLADIHADTQNIIPRFFAGPGAYDSTDPDVITAFTQLNALLPFAVREGLLFRSQLFTAVYIQNNICDFGLQIISV